MSSDLTGGADSADPGIDQLFRILTGGPAEGELAGEQDALAMFRANVSPLASQGLVNGATVPFRPIQDGSIPAGRPASEPKRSVRHPFRAPARWGLRLGVAGVIAIAGGTAAAAYAAVLPAPVQNLAHQLLGGIGVPDAHHRQHTGSSRGHGHQIGASGSHSSTAPGRSARPSQGVKPSPSVHASVKPSTSPRVSPSPSPSTTTGSAVLTASAPSTNIPAGTAPVINGQLTRSGTGIPGVTVTLIERLTGQLLWHVAGTGQTDPAGNVTVTGPPLTQNAVFRLRFPGGVHSTGVLVTVTPQVDVVLTPGASALRDLLTVTTQYARAGNVVWLEVQSANGTWVKLRKKRLNADGKTWFILSGKRLKNKTVEVLLVATIRHASAVSNTAIVPPPT
ncbi:MAG TPA: hypothetical protein VMB74_15585 [Streptosporangiaceae bacterium]|nr:hypothetical protein [Streptosporangiaceae bacterium]